MKIKTFLIAYHVFVEVKFVLKTIKIFRNENIVFEDDDVTSVDTDGEKVIVIFTAILSLGIEVKKPLLSLSFC